MWQKHLDLPLYSDILYSIFIQVIIITIQLWHYWNVKDNLHVKCIKNKNVTLLIVIWCLLYLLNWEMLLGECDVSTI